MHASTLYNITRTRVYAGAQAALAALAVLLFISCTSSGVLEEIQEIDTNGKDPLNFTCLTEDSEREHSTTRAAQLLNTDFMVSTYKAYNTPKQYPVMERYHVEYKTSGTAWDGNIRPYWDYTQVTGQYEKFWDYSAFPYRFHAVAPNPTSSAVTMDDHKLEITSAYQMQTVLNGMVTPTDKVAEPYIVSQVQRQADGRDYDLLATNHPREINTTSTTRNRYVALPFHHLNSKVRFGIYSTTPWTTANPLYIQGLTIRAYSPDFVTGATGYHADGTNATVPGGIISGHEHSWYLGTGNSGFTGLTKVQLPTTHTQLLRFDGGKEVADNDLSLHQGRSSAFWLQCPDGIMQIPQENVTLCVSFELYRMDGDSEPYKVFNDIPIQMEDGTRQYNWLSGYIHTYYLIIGEIEDRLEITFTATLTPWEDVTGSLTTDLEK